MLLFFYKSSSLWKSPFLYVKEVAFETLNGFFSSLSCCIIIFSLFSRCFCEGRVDPGGFWPPSIFDLEMLRLVLILGRDPSLSTLTASPCPSSSSRASSQSRRSTSRTTASVLPPAS